VSKELPVPILWLNKFTFGSAGTTVGLTVSFLDEDLDG